MSSDDRSSGWQEYGEYAPGGLDVTVPVSARIWNYWMGGKDYYQADKVAGDEFAALFPGIRDMARASRLFLGRVVSYLAGEAGVHQFLDIGTGLPTEENTHEVAERTAPGSRIVYVDNDPMVMTHARALMTGTGAGRPGYIEADLNDPEKIVSIARQELDFTRPVAIMLMGILGHIGNPDENGDQFASSVLDCLKAALPAGGYLVIRDATDTAPAHVRAVRTYAETGAVPYRLRSPEQITRFFDGLEAVEPGIVPIQRWRPDQRSAQFPADINMWGGVAVKRPPALSATPRWPAAVKRRARPARAGPSPGSHGSRRLGDHGAAGPLPVGARNLAIAGAEEPIEIGLAAEPGSLRHLPDRIGGGGQQHGRVRET